MTVEELVREVCQRGVVLSTDPPNLFIEPARKVPPALKAELKARKAEVIQYMLTVFTPESGTPLGQQRDSRQDKSLEARLSEHGISIAIDRKTGSALLLFKPSDVEIVRDVAADVYQPFDAGRLTPQQRKEVRGSLDYYDNLLARKVKP